MTCHCSPIQPTRVLFFVLVDLGGRFGLAWPERDPSHMDREHTLQDIRSGDLHNVVQIIETEICGAEISSRDVTECLLAEAASHEPDDGSYTDDPRLGNRFDHDRKLRVEA